MPAPGDSEVTTRLVERLIEHCSIVDTTGDEDRIADAVADYYTSRGDSVTRVRKSVVVGEPSGDRPVLLYVGHLDVVAPTDDDLVTRRQTRDGQAVVVGRGTSDMKSGNVVAMDLFDDQELRSASNFDAVLVLYSGEEGPAEGNELADVLTALPWLADAALAIVLEPTDLEVQAGCLGGLHATLTFHGQAAHSARPWHGENALTKAGAFLAELHGRQPRDVPMGPVVYRDVFTATQASAAGGRNVVPAEFSVNLNYRFAPDRDCDAAEAELRELVGDRAEVTIIDRAIPAPPHLDDPNITRLVACAGGSVSAKQAWTDVARFAQIGVPAVNFGPGLTTQAHQRGEFVPVANLAAARAVLEGFETA